MGAGCSTSAPVKELAEASKSALETAEKVGKATVEVSKAARAKAESSSKAAVEASKSAIESAEKASRAARAKAEASTKLAVETGTKASKLSRKGVGKVVSITQKTAAASISVVKDAAHDVKQHVLGAEQVTDVDDATPDGLWFTPSSGWKQGDEWQQPLPPPLMPSERDLLDALEMKTLPPPFKQDAIGELRVEVLECEDLHQSLMQVGTIDPFAVVVFEGAAARTTTVWNSRSPRWGSRWPRAFAFPVVCPHSTLYVAVSHEDPGAAVLGTVTEPIGHVALPLSSLRADTQYDCWFELSLPQLWRPDHAATGAAPKKDLRGYIRLRFSLTFRDSRTRLTAYFKPFPYFVVPFATRQKLRNSRVAYRGRHNSNKFSFKVFTSYAEELKADGRALLELCERVAFYKSPALSLLLCAFYQLVVSHPAYVLSLVPLVPLAVIVYNFLHSPPGGAPDNPITARPTLVEVAKMLFVNAPEPPLHVVPEAALQAEGVDDDPEAGGAWHPESAVGDAAKRGAAAVHKWGGAAMTKFGHVMKLTTLGGLGEIKRLAAGGGGGGAVSLQDELERLRGDVDEEVEQEVNGMTPRDERVGNQMNPIYKVLAPLQVRLGHAVEAARLTRRLLE